ncbi:hypothetical protein GGR57DRAFT_508092 [Xylariaceae sp. FL1272]|nr:hypothetical protein GGR57DRAFT_508092 [Xylariaceae sp. FL1272]
MATSSIAPSPTGTLGSPPIFALDFGSSSSAISLWWDGRVTTVANYPGVTTWPFARVGPETFDVPTLCGVHTRQPAFGYEATRDLPPTIEITELDPEKQDRMISSYMKFLHDHAAKHTRLSSTGLDIDSAHWVVTIPCAWMTEEGRPAQERFVRLAESAFTTTVYITTEIQAAVNALLSDNSARDQIMQGYDACTVLFCHCGGSTFSDMLASIQMRPQEKHPPILYIRQPHGGFAGSDLLNKFYEHFVLEKLASQYKIADRVLREAICVQALALFDQQKRSIENPSGLRVIVPDPAVDSTVYDLSLSEDDSTAMLEQGYSSFFRRMQALIPAMRNQHKSNAPLQVVFNLVCSGAVETYKQHLNLQPRIEAIIERSIFAIRMGQDASKARILWDLGRKSDRSELTVNRGSFHDFATFSAKTIVGSDATLLFFLRINLEPRPTTFRLFVNNPSTSTTYSWELDDVHLDIGTNTLVCAPTVAQAPKVEKVIETQSLIPSL